MDYVQTQIKISEYLLDNYSDIVKRVRWAKGIYIVQVKDGSKFLSNFYKFLDDFEIYLVSLHCIDDTSYVIVIDEE
jgi:hypothetical protein